jgi:hypothetical protein
MDNLLKHYDLDNLPINEWNNSTIIQLLFIYETRYQGEYKIPLLQKQNFKF